MKKVMVWVLSLILILSAAGVYAGNAEPFFEQFAGMAWSFCSGVGGWSTDLEIQADGSFNGTFHDSELGDTGELFPYGTIYGCSFTGRMSLLEQVDENAWKIRVDALSMDEGQLEEAIEDGIRYVTVEPYGVSEGDEMLLYRPGTPVSVLSESMQFWAHVVYNEDTRLEDWFLGSEANDSGFVGFRIVAESALENPWADMTAEQLAQVSGVSFGLPEGAENVVYRWLESERLAEMQFTLEGGSDEFCARIQPAALEEGQLMNISGMYFAWENEEEVSVGHCYGTIGQAQTGSEDWVELCLWYDAASGLMYSLSVCSRDLDGLDLTVVAEHVYAKTGSQDGERFEGVIMLEGMEETVRYEHIRNDTIGFEMDYDYERFERRSESDRESFVSRYDDPNHPENYLEVTFSPADAEAAAASVSETLSSDYDIIVESFMLDGAGSCTRIDASEAKGGKGTPDLLQTVYVIPAADGSLIATAHYSFESAEGFGARLQNMMHTLVVIDGRH